MSLEHVIQQIEHDMEMAVNDGSLYKNKVVKAYFRGQYEALKKLLPLVKLEQLVNGSD